MYVHFAARKNIIIFSHNEQKSPFESHYSWRLRRWKNIVNEPVSLLHKYKVCEFKVLSAV